MVGCDVGCLNPTGQQVGHASPLCTTSCCCAHLLTLQASFDPPGITIAVKKDRGMETMLQPGNAFAVSMVPESQEKVVMKVRHAWREQQAAGHLAGDSRERDKAGALD